MTDSTDFEQYASRCNWCSKYVTLVPNKKYCVQCKSKCFRECTRCHRPFDSAKYFEQNDTRCNACMKKYLKEASKPVLSDVDMSEMNDTSDSDIDPPKKGKPSIKAKQSTSIVLTSSESEKSETTSKQKKKNQKFLLLVTEKGKMQIRNTLR